MYTNVLTIATINYDCGSTLCGSNGDSSRADRSDARPAASSIGSSGCNGSLSKLISCFMTGKCLRDGSNDVGVSTSTVNTGRNGGFTTGCTNSGVVVRLCSCSAGGAGDATSRVMGSIGSGNAFDVCKLPSMATCLSSGNGCLVVCASATVSGAGSSGGDSGCGRHRRIVGSFGTFGGWRCVYGGFIVRRDKS